jgi:hypothetical protein
MLIEAGSTNPESQSVRAHIPPTIQPISGKYLAALFNRSPPCRSDDIGEGSLVKNVRAAKNI